MLRLRGILVVSLDVIASIGSVISTCIVVREVGVVVPVRGPWAIVAVISAVAAITVSRSLSAIPIIGILF